MKAMTYKDKDSGAEVHERLDCALVEGVGDGVGVLVVATLADPGSVAAGTRRRGAAAADELELRNHES